MLQHDTAIHSVRILSLLVVGIFHCCGCSITWIFIFFFFNHTVHSITNPTLLFALAFCFGAWWFISIRNNSENIRLFGEWQRACSYLVVVL